MCNKKEKKTTVWVKLEWNWVRGLVLPMLVFGWTTQLSRVHLPSRVPHWGPRPKTKQSRKQDRRPDTCLIPQPPRHAAAWLGETSSQCLPRSRPSKNTVDQVPVRFTPRGRSPAT